MIVRFVIALVVRIGHLSVHSVFCFLLFFHLLLAQHRNATSRTFSYVVVVFFLSPSRSSLCHTAQCHHRNIHIRTAGAPNGAHLATSQLSTSRYSRNKYTMNNRYTTHRETTCICMYVLYVCWYECVSKRVSLYTTTRTIALFRRSSADHGHIRCLSGSHHTRAVQDINSCGARPNVGF